LEDQLIGWCCIDRLNRQAQADHAALNVNAFTIATDGIDGVRRASERRAIFSEVFEDLQNTAGMPPDLVEVLNVAEAIPSLASMPKFAGETVDCRLANAIQESRDFGQAMWRRGGEILRAVERHR